MRFYPITPMTPTPLSGYVAEAPEQMGYYAEAPETRYVYEAPETMGYYGAMPETIGYVYETPEVMGYGSPEAMGYVADPPPGFIEGYKSATTRNPRRWATSMKRPNRWVTTRKPLNWATSTRCPSRWATTLKPRSSPARLRLETPDYVGETPEQMGYVYEMPRDGYLRGGAGPDGLRLRSPGADGILRRRSRT